MLKKINFKKINSLMVLSICLALGGCVPENTSNSANSANVNNNSAENAASDNDADSNSEVSTLGSESDDDISPEKVEAGRLDQDWKKFAQLDEPTEKNNTPNTEKWSDITMEKVNSDKQYTPLVGDVAGPSVLRAQILLDRTNFSPGIIDGKWGKNTEKAVYWMQKTEGLPAHGEVDQKTYQKLIELAGKPDKFITAYKLTESDVKGEFKKIPADIYEKAKADCMCYESLEEKLAEKFHISPALLKQLNPQTSLKDLKAGDSIMVPNQGSATGKSEQKVARIVVSGGGFYVHGLDSEGKIVVHYPTTLGSKYNPSPSGEYKVTAIAKDPSWHYQPELLNEGKGKDAMIPPGPNNAVGVMWIALSKPHFGIHGTKAPETIGYTSSHGCIRLTNWDVLDLGGRIEKGVPVEFQDIAGRSGGDGSNSNSEDKNGG